jgi:tetratricopeptide (TPR) repeat protein
MKESSDDLLGNILLKNPSRDTLVLVLRRMEENKQYSRIIQECLRALQRYPDDLPLRLLLAKSYLRVGFIGQAEAEFAKIGAAIDRYAVSYRHQADLLMRQQRNPEAAAALKRYLAHYPDDPEALDLLRQITRGREERDRAVPESGVRLQPQDENREFSRLATPTLAEIYYKQGQIDAAIRTYRKVLDQKPHAKAARDRLAELQALVGQELPEEKTSARNRRDKNKKMAAILEGWLARLQQP